MIEDIQLFGFRALWSPYYLAFLVIIGVLYWKITGSWRTRFKNNQPPLSKTRVYFFIVLALLYIIKGSPIDLLGHLMFSVHMTQMAILYLVIPPLLLLGMPKWLLNIITAPKGIHKFVKLFTKPLLALILFNGLFSIYHIPVVFDVVKTDVWAHGIYTSILFVSAILMWWPVIGPLPQYYQIDGLKKIGYLIANGVLLTPACGLIIFAQHTLYNTYSDPQFWLAALQLCVPASMLATLDLQGPMMFSWLPDVQKDQQLGGVLMKIIQEVIFGYALAVIFYRWAKIEQQVDKIDDLTLLTPETNK